MEVRVARLVGQGGAQRGNGNGNFPGLRLGLSGLPALEAIARVLRAQFGGEAHNSEIGRCGNCRQQQDGGNSVQ